MGKPGAQDVLSWLSVGQAVIPQIAQVVVHYKQLSESGKLEETDVTKMQENLKELEFTDWDLL